MVTCVRLTYTEKVRILLATTNHGKLAEVQQILGEYQIEVIGLGVSESTEEIEVGATFAENALLKARHYYQLAGIPTVADDSGLEVDALGEAPGVHSARYAGPQASDADRIQRLLEEMRDIPDRQRRAKFTCAAVVVSASGEKVFIDHVAGVIMNEPRGKNGFGFDPVFFYEPLAKTFGEISSSEKSAISHRGRAFRRLGAWLAESGLLDTPKSNDRIETTAD